MAQLPPLPPDVLVACSIGPVFAQSNLSARPLGDADTFGEVLVVGSPPAANDDASPAPAPARA